MDKEFKASSSFEGIKGEREVSNDNKETKDVAIIPPEIDDLTDEKEIKNVTGAFEIIAIDSIDTKPSTSYACQNK